MTVKPFDAFIDKLVEVKKAKLPESLETITVFSVLRRNFETMLLPEVKF